MKKKWFFGRAEYILAAIITAVFILDRLTKLYLEDGCFWKLCIRNEINTGAAFGILPGQTLLLVLVALLVLVVIAIYYRQSDKLTRIGMAFIAAGTIANLFDRLFYGYVLDVFAVFGSSSFNVADLSNLMGALVLVYSLFKPTKR